MQTLLIPVIDFDVVRRYSELEGCAVTSVAEGVSQRLDVAIQTIRFRLDERGASIYSEAIAAGGTPPPPLLFDKPFLIYLKRRSARNPYFAAWIANTELLVCSPPPQK